MALGLAGTGVRTLLVESIAPDSAARPSFDGALRLSAMPAAGSSKAWGVRDPIARDAAAIRAIHVSDAGRFGFARLKAADHGIDAFGYVVPNRAIGAALWRRLADVSGVNAACPPASRISDHDRPRLLQGGHRCRRARSDIGASPGGSRRGTFHRPWRRASKRVSRTTIKWR